MCGHLKALTDDLMGARSEFQRALTLFRKAGNEVSVLESVSNLADISWSLGELDAAEASLREYIAMRGSPYVRRSRLGFALANLAGVLTQRDDLDGALRAAREALPLLADAAEAWCFMDHFALRAALAGKLDDAAIIAGYADAIHALKEAQRDPNEARARERLHALLRDRIFVQKLESLLERGAGMSEAEVCQLIAGA
jgi:tetratricopeptide (TPR) repeat protein